LSSISSNILTSNVCRCCLGSEKPLRIREDVQCDESTVFGYFIPGFGPKDKGSSPTMAPRLWLCRGMSHGKKPLLGTLEDTEEKVPCEATLGPGTFMHSFS